MNEVEIVCLGDSAEIPDLGLRMVRGARYTVSFVVADRSKDLERAKAQGIVGVKIMRARIVRPEPPRVPVPSSNQRMIERAQTPASPSAAVPASPSVADPEILSALRELTSEVRKLRAEVRESRLPEDWAATIATAIANGLSGLKIEGGVPSGASGKKGEPGAVFIPSGIVPKKTDLDLPTSTTVTGDVDEAREALRKAKKGSKNA